MTCEDEAKDECSIDDKLIVLNKKPDFEGIELNIDSFHKLRDKDEKTSTKNVSKPNIKQLKFINFNKDSQQDGKKKTVSTMKNIKGSQNLVKKDENLTASLIKSSFKKNNNKKNIIFNQNQQDIKLIIDNFLSNDKEKKAKSPQRITADSKKVIKNIYKSEDLESKNNLDNKSKKDNPLIKSNINN